MLKLHKSKPSEKLSDSIGSTDTKPTRFSRGTLGWYTIYVLISDGHTYIHDNQTTEQGLNMKNNNPV